MNIGGGKRRKKKSAAEAAKKNNPIINCAARFFLILRAHHVGVAFAKEETLHVGSGPTINDGRRCLFYETAGRNRSSDGVAGVGIGGDDAVVGSIHGG